MYGHIHILEGYLRSFDKFKYDFTWSKTLIDLYQESESRLTNVNHLYTYREAVVWLERLTTIQLHERNDKENEKKTYIKYINNDNNKKYKRNLHNIL